MALENRNGNLYYYRSVRKGDKVLKLYAGAGKLAQIMDESETMRRAAREAERDRAREELERFEALGAPVVELCEVAEILERAALVAGGYHRHKGEWRLRRGRREREA